MTRLARCLVLAAARRWPPDLAEIMTAEWLAEIEALRVEPGRSPLRRQCRVLVFAGSLALSPAVEAEGAEPVGRIESWGRWLAGAAGVTLLAGGLFNGVHAVQHRAGGGWAAAALLGARCCSATPPRWPDQCCCAQPSPSRRAFSSPIAFRPSRAQNQ
jgi:hypothetical protein